MQAHPPLSNRPKNHGHIQGPIGAHSCTPFMNALRKSQSNGTPALSSPTVLRREIRSFGLSDRSARSENSGTTYSADCESFPIPLNVLGIGLPRNWGKAAETTCRHDKLLLVGFVSQTQWPTHGPDPPVCKEARCDSSDTGK